MKKPRAKTHVRTSLPAQTWRELGGASLFRGIPIRTEPRPYKTVWIVRLPADYYRGPFKTASMAARWVKQSRALNCAILPMGLIDA